MTTASLELCQELWNLSRWSGTDYRWYEDKGVDYVDIKGTNGLSLPAYDLGYLLRKAPYTVQLSGGHDFWQSSCNGYIGTADNPEDAACKLAIELFKRGVLTKEATP